MDEEKCAVCGNVMSQCTCPKPEAGTENQTPVDAPATPETPAQ